MGGKLIMLQQDRKELFSGRQSQTYSPPVSSQLELGKIPGLQHMLNLSVSDRLQLSSHPQSGFSGGVFSLKSSTADEAGAMSVTEVSPAPQPSFF